MTTTARPDRRVSRTQRLLQEALVALIIERGYGAVTVQDVLDRADVGRATFYSHYENKEALLLSVFAALRGALRQELTSLTPERVARFGQGVGLLTPLFAHAAEHRRLYRALLGSRDGAVLLGYLRDALAVPLGEHLEEMAARHGHPPGVPVPLIVAGYASAVLGVLVWWLEAELPMPPVEMDRIVERLVAPGVARLFGVSDPDAAIVSHGHVHGAGSGADMR